MVERAENGRELCLFDNKRLSEEELIQTHKNRTPPRERNALVASGDFKKTELIDERLEDKGAMYHLISRCEEGKVEVLTHDSMRHMFNPLPKGIWILLRITTAFFRGIQSIYGLMKPKFIVNHAKFRKR